MPSLRVKYLLYYDAKKVVPIITIILLMTFVMSLNYATFNLVYVLPLVHYYY